MSLIDLIREAPDEQGRYFMVVKDSDGQVGVVPLMLDGSETRLNAAKKFLDAVLVSSQAMAAKHGYWPCNYHVDGKPRSEFELATQDYLRKMQDIGWDNADPTTLPEYQKMVALRPPPDSEYWSEVRIQHVRPQLMSARSSCPPAAHVRPQLLKYEMVPTVTIECRLVS